MKPALAALAALALCLAPSLTRAQPAAQPAAPKTYSARLLSLEVEPLKPDGDTWDIKVPKLPLPTELPDLLITVTVNGIDVLTTPVAKDTLSATFELDPLTLDADSIVTFKVWDADPLKPDLIGELPIKPTAEQSASNEPITLSSASVKALRVVFFGGVLAPTPTANTTRVVERAEEAARRAAEAAEAARRAAEAAAEAREALEGAPQE